VAGGFKNDLLALNDLTPHDERYARLLEYATVIQNLLRTGDPVSFFGDRPQRPAHPHLSGRLCSSLRHP
jgi:alkanesulfonate monooxygenase SsuD/methylene tetrahydromethanopterin reductase-like flavin-dependent oxidoreductase (luciferase family)